MAENQVSVELNIEVQDALKAISNANKTIESFAKTTQTNLTKTEGFFSSLANSAKNTFSKAFRIESLADFNALTEVLPKILNGVRAIGEFAIDQALKAEEIRAINQQFEVLANNAGIAADVLKNNLVNAADGLVDTEDLLNAASGSIVALGKNAERLGDVFNVARQAASVFGGDALQRFEEISGAIERLSTRQLKQFGIVLDQDAVFKQYAQTLGIAADRLTTTEKQTALLNAVLEKSKTAFAGVDVNIRELANNNKRLSVAFGELGDASATALDKLFGPIVKEGTKELTIAIENLTLGIRKIGGEAIPAQEQVKVLQRDISRLTELKLADEKATGSSQAGAVYEQQIKALEKQIALIEKRNALEAGGTGDLPLNLDPQAAKNALRQVQAEAAATTITPTIDPEVEARNQARLEQERALQVELQNIRNQAAIAEAEQDVLKRDALSLNRLQELETLQGFERAKLDIEFNTQLERAKLIQDSDKRKDEIAKIQASKELAFTKLKNKQEIDLIKARQVQEQQIEQIRLQAAGNFIQAGLNLAKEGSIAQKALQITQATVATYTAANQALASPPGPPFTLPLVASTVALGLSNIARISGAKFAQGGIVPGTSFAGDRVQARVNSGEMILNRAQQAELFRVAKGESSAFSTSDLGAEIRALGNRIAGMNIVVQANAREIARLVRDEREAGFA